MADEDGHEALNTGKLQRLTIKDGALFWDKNKIKADIGLSDFQEKLAIVVAVITIASLVVSGAVSGFELYDRFNPPSASTSTTTTAPQAP